jgi:hypothetical protein
MYSGAVEAHFELVEAHWTIEARSEVVEAHWTMGAHSGSFI